MDKWIAFVRKKAITAGQTQKTLTSAPVHRKAEKASSKPSIKIYHNEATPIVDQAPPKHKAKQPKNTNKKCNLCSDTHYVFQCKRFLEMTVAQRKNHVQTAGLCSNCLRTGHKTQDCSCSFRCRICQSVHNTLLHTDAVATTQVNHVLHTTDSESKPQTEHKMLMTSMVVITGPQGQKSTVRAMLDSGAESSIISKKVMSELRLQPIDWVNLSGVESASHTPVRPKVRITISSTKGDWSKTITPVVLSKVTINLPRHDLKELQGMPHLQNLSLANPRFYQPRRVDMILDSDIFDEVLLPKKVTGPPGSPSAWDTILGWGVMGRYQVFESNSAPPVSINVNSVEEAEGTRVDKSIERFWLMEELPKGNSILSPQELAVQTHFLNTHYYSPPAGRYVVTLPKKVTTQQLGDSFVTAKSRFIRNEAALLKRKMWEPFQAVVKEYIALGHAQLVTQAEMCTPTHSTYHFPMHAVHKTSSTTTKLRVVFDASCPSSSGLSLNDILFAGPTLHPNLDKILIKFRTYRVAVSADVGKMYREVILSQEDRQLHRFVWREQTDQPLSTYCMNRVTFGVRSSPYVAVRALQQASVDLGVSGSAENWHICNSFYVDDLLAGADDISAAKGLYHSIRNILLKAGFQLKKWRSSSPEVLAHIPTELQEPMPQQDLVDSRSATYPKTLGIVWDSEQDVMFAQVQLPGHYVSTKRGIVSDTAKSYDILGWLAPFILPMKTLFQLLWKMKLDWDTPLEESLAEKHKEWREQLPLLKSVVLDRCYFGPAASISVSLHGFSDASEAAFAAAVYIRAVYIDGSVSSKLVVAKTRVAPLHTVSMPRLELCGAEMLSELLSTVGNTLNIDKQDFHGWCDSTVALAWLQSCPSNYKTFVANRVASAARNVPPSIWKYVPTDQNPADSASRGISAQELLEHPLWWSGPPWLLSEPVAVPTQPVGAEIAQHQEVKAKPAAIFTNSTVTNTGWEQKFKCYKKLLHATAYAIRFSRQLYKVNLSTSCLSRKSRMQKFFCLEGHKKELILQKSEGYLLTTTLLLEKGRLSNSFIHS